ncbi:MAG: electron transfer flavoprotein subunit beta/FixA family protein [Pseudomonadota bacterium]
MKRIIVCVKPVPDPKHWDRVSLDPETMTLRREGIPNVVNPLDRQALEAALQIKESFGGEVVLLSMAPSFAASTLREMLAMGADRAVLLSDRLFAGSDTLATAGILAAGIRKIGPFDLILCGNMTLDGSTAQVPSQLAELLGLPNVMHVAEIRWPDQNTCRLTQRVENGRIVWEASLPLLVSVVKEINKPRYISFLGIIEADKKELTVWSNDILNLDPLLLGLAGSPTKMAGLTLRRSRRAKEILSGEAEDLARELAQRLVRRGFL